MPQAEEAYHKITGAFDALEELGDISFLIEDPAPAMPDEGDESGAVLLPAQMTAKGTYKPVFANAGNGLVQSDFKLAMVNNVVSVISAHTKIHSVRDYLGGVKALKPWAKHHKALSSWMIHASIMKIVR